MTANKLKFIFFNIFHKNKRKENKLDEGILYEIFCAWFIEYIMCTDKLHEDERWKAILEASYNSTDLLDKMKATKFMNNLVCINE